MILDEHVLIYVDGSFIVRNDLQDGDAEACILEFDVNVKHLLLITGRSRLIIAVLEDNRVAFLNIDKEFKVLNTVDLPQLKGCELVAVRSHGDKLYFLVKNPYFLIEIENVFLASRLDSAMIQERFQQRQVLKCFKFALNASSVLADFMPLDDGTFLFAGKSPMLSWWKISEDSTKNALIPAAITNFLRPLIRQPDAPQSSPSTGLMEQVRILTENDRGLDKIIGVGGDLALVEDAEHGRVLWIHLKLGIIVKISKGYRQCTAAKKANGWHIWAGNRGRLEKHPANPLANDQPKALLTEEEQECGQFCNQTLILFNPTSNLLRIFPIE